MVFDFGALPPEVNSGKIYSGPGSAPLLAAATAWDALASELQTTAAGYAATITELSSNWQGPSSTAAADAAAPFTEWLSSTAAQAEQTAAQAQAAAAAYEAAFAASIPPPVIEANRALLAALVATNFLGVNTPAIAATEATYAEFWAQDAGAMYAYAGAASTATQLTPFTEAPATTNDSGQATQAASTAQSAAASSADSTTDAISALLTQLNSQITQFGTELGTLNSQLTALLPQSSTTLAQLVASLGLPPSVTNGITLFNQFLTTGANTMSTWAAGPWTPLGFGSLLKNWWQVSISIPSLGTGIQGIGPLIHPTPITGALSPLLHSGLLSGSYGGASNAGTLASVGRAGTIGGLSVPQNWAAATPAVRTVAAEMEASAVDAAPEMGLAQPGMFGQTALSSLAGRALGGTATRAAVGQGYRVPGAVAADEIATTATIIVIPPSAE
ncbi:hypothetical protein A5658_11290 [Mycobacterium sp. 1245111.1]|uniref:PPE family protein n=1 Tax=Mycobacterium sp. 1245111.1 TaxID=1834073 RepID=UPI0008000A84|nr:PPE family protein [Mycobacterium sp. 1245111.1]OBK34346.1 hypothetical protein A5658_11290 [Mycobacterium sp. 1245111.1]